MTLSEAGHPWNWYHHLLSNPDPFACNICWWSGQGFDGSPGSESAFCPRCGSIARDRFLFFCFVRTAPSRRYRVLETSPRLGPSYQQSMGEWFDYSASDYDQKAHRTGLQLDLQDLDLPTDSIEILLTPHVLEHVPDTDRALAEMFRVLVPGGRMYLQVPVQQGFTTPPPSPEFHGDQTPVHWKFGPDLTGRLREHGFETRVLCNWGFYRHVEARNLHWPDPTPADIDVRAVLEAVRLEDLVPVADEPITRRLSLHPGYMFLTWEGVKPGGRLSDHSATSIV